MDITTTEKIKSDLISQLDEDQRRILTRGTNHNCILAAAGSGKTRCIIHSILYDLANGIRPDELIAFTFTEKAANELFLRTYTLAEDLLGLENLQGLSIGTIHSWCFNYLTSMDEYTNYSPLDELYLDSIVSRLHDTLKLDKIYETKFPRGVDNFLRDLEIYYNELIDPKYLPVKIKNSIIKFIEILTNERLLTYGGMIRNTVEDLTKRGPIPKLKRLYVDEYQDVNPAQVELIKKMLPNDAQLVVVGDDLQCIYNWRGSDVSRIVKFDSDFIPSDVKKLEKNYRSLPGIVNFCNSIGNKIRVRDTTKKMRPVRRSESVSPINWFAHSEEENQAEAIANIIINFRNGGFMYRDIAILLRSVKNSGTCIAKALEKKDIPYISPTLSRGGSLIKDLILPIVHFLANPPGEARNEEEEMEIVNYLEDFQLKLSLWIPDKNKRQNTLGYIGKIAATIVNQSDSAFDIRGNLYNILEIAGVGSKVSDTNITLSLGIVSQIIRSVEEAHRRRIKGIKRKDPIGVWSEAYYAILRRSIDFGESIPLTTYTDEVSILTVHQAKGLEWPIVIIPSLHNGLFPVRSRKHECSFDEDIVKRYGTSLEDEWRLFYVSTTRAKDRIVLMDYSDGTNEKRSTFIDEIINEVTLTPTSIDKVPKSYWKNSSSNKIKNSDMIIRIAVSDILMYLECPYQYGLRRLVNIEPSVGDELGFGKGMHELFQQRYEAQRNWSDSEIDTRAKDHIFLPLMSEESERAQRISVKKRLKELQHLKVFTGKILTELPIEIPLKYGLVSGTIDVVRILEGHVVSLIDWKSNIHNQFIRRYTKQIQMYAYALRIQGYDVRSAELIDIGNSYKEKKIVSMQIDITEHSIRKLLNEVNDAMEKIANSKFLPTPSDITCTACDVKRLCLERIDLNEKTNKKSSDLDSFP